MEELTSQTGLSCHLTVLSGKQFMVIAQMDPDWQMGWSVRLGAILAYNWVVTTALGYFLWAKVLTAIPATTAGQVLALTPVGGFLLSTVIFGGAITADVVASIGLIVAGIILTLRA